MGLYFMSNEECSYAAYLLENFDREDLSVEETIEVAAFEALVELDYAVNQAEMEVFY